MDACRCFVNTCGCMHACGRKRGMHACHAWYLVEESEIFSLFGSASNEATRVIADKLRLVRHPEEFRRGKPVLRQRIDENTTVVDLVDPDSWFMFEALSMDYDWLSEPATT